MKINWVLAIQWHIHLIYWRASVSAILAHIYSDRYQNMQYRTPLLILSHNSGRATWTVNVKLYLAVMKCLWSTMSAKITESLQWNGWLLCIEFILYTAQHSAVVVAGHSVKLQWERCLCAEVCQSANCLVYAFFHAPSLISLCASVH